MESSFLEDLLKREVDQSQVNALVGTFENQLTTPSGIPLPTKTNAISTAQQLTSLTRLVSQQATVQSSVPAQNVTAQGATFAANQLNGRLVSAAGLATSISGGKIIQTLSPQNVSKSPRPPTPISHAVGKQISSPRVPDMSASGSPRPMTSLRNTTGASSPAPPTSQVYIAPKITTNTVPIAPRPGNPPAATNNILITPRQAQLLMAQRFGPGATLLPNNLLARIPGGGIPVMPNMINSARVPVPPVMNTQIPRIRTARAPVPRGARTPMSPQIGGSLTQVKTTINSAQIPGQVNYRLRQMAPASSHGTNANGAAPLPAAANAANITMMKESVKRLKEFFQNLINLACGPSQPPEIGKMVKELVHNLMQNRVSEEEFIEKLQKTLKSDPQPNLVHFLKKTLPHLRETIKKQQMQQVPKAPQSTRQPRPGTFISHGLRGPRPGVLTGAPRHSAPRTRNPVPRHITPQQLLANKNLTPQEQSALAKQFHPSRVVVANVTGQTPATGLNKSIQNALHGKMPGLLQGAAAAKDKPKNTYYSSAVGGDDDINDVTCMAGVNLMEESQKILATGADFMHYQTRSINDVPILIMDRLKHSVERSVKKYELTNSSPEVLTLISHAAEERMRLLLERLTACSLHRGDPHKDEVKYESISDVRNQLRVFEEIDEVERKHRESREREMLMRVAKSRSRTEDPEQARLKEKAKQMQMEEEEINRKRAANRTALEAIGGPKKKRKLDEALESLQNSQTPSGGANSSTPSNSNTTSQSTRSRQHRITLKDLQFVLESDRDTAKSLVLYRSHVNR